MALLPKNQRDQMMVAARRGRRSRWRSATGTYVWSPKHDELDELQTRVDTLDVSEPARARRELAQGNGDELRAEAAQLQRDLEVMRQLVPTGNEVPGAARAGLDGRAPRRASTSPRVEPQPVIDGEQFDTYRYKVARHRRLPRVRRVPRRTSAR